MDPDEIRTMIEGIDDSIFRHRVCLKRSLSEMESLRDSIIGLEKKREGIEESMEDRHSKIGKLVAEKWALQESLDRMGRKDAHN